MQNLCLYFCLCIWILAFIAKQSNSESKVFSKQVIKHKPAFPLHTVVISLIARMMNLEMRVRKFVAPFRVLGWSWHSVTHTEFISVFTSVNVFILSNWTQTHPVTQACACTYTVVSHQSHLNHLDCAYEKTIREKNEPFLLFSAIFLFLSLACVQLTLQFVPIW